MKEGLFTIAALVALLATAVCACAQSQSTKLPAPQTAGGVPVLDAIENRASAVSGRFPTGAVSEQELATLLWAASGRNRGGEGWTVPTAMGLDPYVSVYVASKDGAFLYDGKGHALERLSTGDARAKVSSQPFANSAPYILVFVIKGKDGVNYFGQALAGAMTQNVYLAAQGLGIGVRFMATMEQENVRKELKLAEDDVPVNIMPVGKR
ncbi:MAG: nitroreductase family protein [Acidobacteriota bacterium]|nr:nitroreductase family protein [Acidobacteriota bacterium]